MAIPFCPKCGRRITHALSTVTQTGGPAVDGPYPRQAIMIQFSDRFGTLINDTEAICRKLPPLPGLQRGVQEAEEAVAAWYEQTGEDIAELKARVYKPIEEKW